MVFIPADDEAGEGSPRKQLSAWLQAHLDEAIQEGADLFLPFMVVSLEAPLSRETSSDELAGILAKATFAVLAVKTKEFSDVEELAGLLEFRKKVSKLFRPVAVYNGNSELVQGIWADTKCRVLYGIEFDLPHGDPVAQMGQLASGLGKLALVDPDGVLK